MKVEILKENGKIKGVTVERIDEEKYKNWLKENSKKDEDISKFEYCLAMNGKEVKLTNDQIVDLKLLIEMKKNGMINIRNYKNVGDERANSKEMYQMTKRLVLNVLDIARFDIDDQFIKDMIDGIKSSMFSKIEKSEINKRVFLSVFNEIFKCPIGENNGLVDVVLNGIEKVGEALK